MKRIQVALLPLVILPLGLLVAGCAPEEEGSGGASGSTRVTAPVNANFDTTRVVTFAVSKSEFVGLGAYVYLKISLQPDLVNHLYLGRVDPTQDFSIELSVPRTAQELHYEIYDELGNTLRGVRTLP
jgi:hypothetical protein